MSVKGNRPESLVNQAAAQFLRSVFYGSSARFASVGTHAAYAAASIRGPTCATGLPPPREGPLARRALSIFLIRYSNFTLPICSGAIE
jgi:hypothetical protein